MAFALLVNVPRQDANRPPAVMAGLAGICKSAGVTYDIADINLHTIKNMDANHWRTFQDYLVGYTDQYNPLVLEYFLNLVDSVLPCKEFSVIAVSMFTFETLRATNLILPILRKRFPSAKIIIGGHGVDFQDADNNNEIFYKHALDKNLIDAYILGEAEEAFKTFLQDPDAWVNSDKRYLVEDLNQIPFANYDLILPQDYFHKGETGAYITGSRGCVRDCTFCDVKAIWKKYRFRSAEHIFNEILHHHLNYGVDTIEFTDNLINGSITEFKKLNRLLVNAHAQYPTLKKLQYRGDFICRPQNQFTEQDFENMANAGGIDLVVGIESFSESVRFHMGKKFTNEDIDFHLYCCGKYGIKNTFLMQCGYPTETLDDHKTNILYLHRYKKYSQTRVIKMIRWGYTTLILPSSPLDTVYKKKLQLEPEVDLTETLYGNWNWISLSNPQLVYQERIRRRMELHYVSKNLGYQQPRVYDEFNFILNDLKKNVAAKKLYSLKNV